MTWLTTLTEALGFGQRPASWKLWAFIILFAVSGTSIFFVSFSLARHKRMVHDLRIQLQAKESELKQKETERRELELKLRLKSIDAQSKEQTKERQKLRKKIDKTHKEIQEGKKKLNKDIKALKGQKLEDLIKQAEKLEKETL